MILYVRIFGASLLGASLLSTMGYTQGLPLQDDGMGKGNLTEYPDLSTQIEWGKIWQDKSVGADRTITNGSATSPLQRLQHSPSEMERALMLVLQDPELQRDTQIFYDHTRRLDSDLQHTDIGELQALFDERLNSESAGRDRQNWHETVLSPRDLQGILDFYGGKKTEAELLHRLSPDVGKRIMMADLATDLVDISVRQTLPGQPMTIPGITPNRIPPGESIPIGDGIKAYGCKQAGFNTISLVPCNDLDSIVSGRTIGRNGDRSQIPFNANGYPEVVFSAVYGSGMVADARGPVPYPRCSVVLIGKKWALSALHCLDSGEMGDDGKLKPRKEGDVINFDCHFDQTSVDAVPSWREMTTRKTAYLALLSYGMNEAVKVERMYIPYGMRETITATGYQSPAKDIVLYELSGDGFSIDESETAYITMPSKARKPDMLTFVGFGWSNISDAGGQELSGNNHFANLRDVGLRGLKQAAYNFLDRRGKAAGSQYPMLQWSQMTNGGGDGGPCRRDSGGPVYAEYYAGLRSPEKPLVGIVSGILTKTPQNEDASLCMTPDATGLAEQVHWYAEDICTLTNNEARGCPSPMLIQARTADR